MSQTKEKQTIIAAGCIIGLISAALVFLGAIASNLAKGFDLETSVERAKDYISGALAAMLDLGKGSGPMDHGFAIKNEFTLSHDEITAEAADKEAK